MFKKLLSLLILMAGLVTPIFSQDVSSSGAFTYSYPINIPPGTNGMAPNLSLNYNSQGGNGMVGMGWSLSGFQSITRDSTYDINWNNSDHFLLNGQRLVPDGDVYRTENESFIKIEYINKDSDKSYWLVTQNNGTKFYLGYNSDNTNLTKDGRIEAIGKGAPRVWSLNKVLDVHGNYYTIEYDEDTKNGDYYPTKIVYTKNGGTGLQLSKHREVVFSYDTTRLDKYPKYNQGKVEADKRLTSIQIKTGEEQLRKYELNYKGQSSSIEPSRLESIKEYGTDGNALPETRFDWGANQGGDFALADELVNPDSYYQPNYAFGTNQNQMDVNGDGKTDLYIEFDYGTLQTYLSKDNGFFLANSQDVGRDIKMIELESVDLNGDGQMDLAGKNNYRKILRTYQSNGDGSFLEKTQTVESNYNNSFPINLDGNGKTDFLFWDGLNYQPILNTENGYKNGTVLTIDGGLLPGGDYTTLYPMDVNGDEKTDLVHYISNGYHNSDLLQVYISNGNGFELNKNQTIEKTQSIIVKLIPMDVDGNGKMDFVVLYTNGILDTYISDGLKFTKVDTRCISNRISNTKSNNLILMDINGDGLMDFLYDQLFSSDDIYLSTGKGFVLVNSLSPLSDSINSYLSPVDVNGDGRMDLISYEKKASVNGFKLKTYLSTGKNFILTNTLPIDGKNQNFHNRGPIEIDGDGNMDFFVGYGIYMRSYLSSENTTSQLQKITLPTGATITPKYTPAPQVPGAIDPNDSSYPDMGNKSPRSLVTSLTVTDGMGNSYESTYEYYNGKTHKGLRDEVKSLGFEWTQKTNPDGSFSKTYYYQEEALLYAGAVKRVENYGSDGLLYSAMENEYKTSPLLATEGYHVVNSIQKSDSYGYNFNGVEYTDWATIKDLTGTLKTRTNYKYDDWGNVVRVYNHGDLDDPSDDSVSTTTYIRNETSCITVPQYTKSYSFGLNEAEFNPLSLETNENLASSQEFFYDGGSDSSIVGGKGNLTRTVAYSGFDNDSNIPDNQIKYPNLVTEFSYDGYGNIIAATDEKGNISTIFYDDNYRTLVAAKQNAYGQITETNTYDNYMRPESTHDMNDNYIWFTYDPFSRQTSVSEGDQSGGTIVLSKTSYSDKIPPIGTPNWVKTGTFVPEAPDDYLESYTYFDGLGQKLQEKIEGLDEENNRKWIVKDYHYNLATNEARSSEPYYSDLPSIKSDFATFNLDEWNTKWKETISYKDAIGRVKKIEFPDGNSEHYHYNLKGKLTLVENGTDTDEDQIIYEEMDGLKQISYSYNKGDYSPSNLIAYAGVAERNKWVYRVTTTTARDGVRVNEISDIDFRDNNEQTDGNTLSTIVDKLGRKKSYTDPDMGTWTYEYDINGNLVTQIDAKGEILGKISFKYDKLNRATVKHGADTVYYCYDGLVNDRSASDGKNHGVSVNGQLTSLYFGSGDYKEDYFYNDKDKKYEITKTIDGKEKTYSSTLDELGRIKEETYPDKDKEKLLYTYNYSGNIDSFFGTYENNQLSDNYIYELRYNIFGKIISFNQGNWSKTIYKYNDKNRLSNINITNRTGIIADMTFEYDGYGNINKKVFRDGFENYFTEDFSYDSLFRLEEAVSNGLYGTKTYTYDSYNNMTGNDGRTYNYDGNNLPHAVSKVVDKNGNDQKIYEYDVNGNVTRITGQSRLVVKAKGTGVDVNPPRMELWINGDASGKPEMVWTVSDTDYKIFTWNGHIPAGASIDIVFANDNHDDDVDTNLYVEFISVNDNMIHSTSSGVVYDRGYGSERFDGENTIPGQEGMAWTGALRFPMPVSALAPVKTLGYDRENRLVSITDDSMSSTFGYNDVGQRIWKIENSSVIEDNKLVEKRIKTYYFFDKYEEEYDITGGEDELVQSIKYYFANGQRVAINSSRDRLSYYHQDHLGSAVRMTDIYGNIVQSIAYAPFGKVAWISGRDTTNYTYTDQEIDRNGFMYYDARYYDPDLGRFLQPDPMLDGMNRYTYCGNNPIRYSDPTGFSYLGEEGVYVIEPDDNGFDDDPYGDNENDNKKKNDEKNKANNPPVVDDDGNVSTNGRASNGGITAEDVGDFVKGVGIGFGKQAFETFIDGLKTSLKITNLAYLTYSLAKDGYDLYNDFVRTGAKSVDEYIGIKVKETINNTVQYVKENPGEATGRGLFIAIEMIVAAKIAKMPKVNGAILEPYGGPGGGHHLPAKSAFRGAPKYDPKKALAIPNAELSRLGVSHSAVSGAQMTGYRAFAKTGKALTWKAIANIERNALIRGQMSANMANRTVNRAIRALQRAGVSKPTRIPWGG